jgi:hypothetical protein
LQQKAAARHSNLDRVTILPFLAGTYHLVRQGISKTCGKLLIPESDKRKKSAENHSLSAL